MKKPQFISIAPGEIDPSPHQVGRRRASRQLVASVREQGILLPLLLRSGSEGRYVLIAGHRRLDAALRLGLETVPAILRSDDDASAASATLAENFHRKDLSPFEEAEAVHRALSAPGASLRKVARELGHTQRWVARRAALRDLHADWLRRAQDPEDELSELPLTRLEDVARLPEVSQATLLARLADRPRWRLLDDKLLTAMLDSVTLSLGSAPWDLDDAELLPRAGACSECPHRASCRAALFPELRGGGEDHCLVADCFEAKRQAHVLRRAEGLRAAHPDLVLVAPPGAGVPEDLAGDGFEVFGEDQLEPVKKKSAGARLCLAVAGPRAGETTWVTPRLEPESARPAKKKSTLADRKARHHRRRVKLALGRLLEAAEEPRRLPAVGELARLVLVFGTVHRCENDYCIDHPSRQWASSSETKADDADEPRLWRLLDRVEASYSEPDQRRAVLEDLWSAVSSVLCRRLAYDPGRDIDQLWTEACRFAAVIGLDADGFFEGAVRELPDPASWAKLEALETSSVAPIGSEKVA